MNSMSDKAAAGRALVSGSIAYDTIMVFADRFANHILPDKINMLNVSFLVPKMRREFGGCAGNIAYNLRLLGDEAYPMATVGRDFGQYLEWLARNDVPTDYLRVIDSELTAQAFITTDLDDNQITAFHPGAMQRSHDNHVGDATGITIGIVSPAGREGMIQHAEQFATRGIPFLFDPGQGLPMFDREQLERFVSQASWVALNQYEWQLLQQKTGWSARDLVQRVRALIVTNGALGSTIYTLEDGELAIPAAAAGEVIDPTGCGDAYRAGLLHGLMRGYDWLTTGRIASLLGAIKVEARGTQNHRFTLEAFKARLGHSFPWVPPFS
jgi:adenosine kinase